MNIAVIAGVVVAVVQLEDIAAQTKLQSQTLRATVANNSAGLVLQIRNMLDAESYNSIRSAVQNNKQTFPILYGPEAKFRRRNTVMAELLMPPERADARTACAPGIG
jgi:hypothetical protein